MRSFRTVWLFALGVGMTTLAANGFQSSASPTEEPPNQGLPSQGPPELPRDPFVPGYGSIDRPPPPVPVESQVRWTLGGTGGHESIQVNVNLAGNNILGDAANEPSIAIDPIDPTRIVIGWRQFDSVFSDFRQAGRAYSHNGGRSWIFPGVLQRGDFGSDPVVDSDPAGNFYYYSLQPDRDVNRPWGCWLYKSTNGGVTFAPGIYGHGGDKAWMTIDKTAGAGAGNIYIVWSPNESANCCGPNLFTRSMNGGQTFMPPIPVPLSPFAGTITTAADGSVYIAGAASGAGVPVMRSVDARVPLLTPTFSLATNANLGGYTPFFTNDPDDPNPAGLLGQVWIATDHSFGPNARNVYVCASVRQFSGGDPLDVMFVASTTGGASWGSPVKINDDRQNGAWQWFATMSVAPNGRIDVVWNDTRNDPSVQRSELYYSYSANAGRTWAPNSPVSLPFEHHVGYPQQAKLGDYYHMISDNGGASLAYAATFNGEQDVYYLRIVRLLDRCTRSESEFVRGTDCNGNGVADDCDIERGTSDDRDFNGIPDDCEVDYDGDGLVDSNDPDIDSDGVVNDFDICRYTPLGYRVRPDGRTFGDADTNDDNRSCTVDLIDYGLFHECLEQGGPEERGLFGYCGPNFDGDDDDDVDLRDVAEFQRWFTGY